MSPKIVLLALAAAVLAVFAFLFVTSDGDPTGAPPPAPSPRVDVQETPTESGARDPAPAESGASTREAAPPARRFVLAGQVIDKVTGAPVAAFHVRVSRRNEGGVGATTVARGPVSDANGRFRFELSQPGVHRLSVHSAHHRRATLDGLVVGDPDGLAGVTVRLDPGLSVSGTVIDDATEEPVEGAIVGSTRGSGLAYLLMGEPDRCVHAVTDAEGRFVLSGLSSEGQKIAAVHELYAEAWQEVVPGRDTEVSIRLKKGPSIFGTVFDDLGRPLAGAWVVMLGKEIPLRRYVVSGTNGQYRTPPVRPGIVELSARPPIGTEEDAFGFSTEWQVADVDDQDVQVDFGIRTDYVTWRGVLFDRDDKPLPRAWVHIFLSPADPVAYERLQSDVRRTRTDAQGRFEFRKLPPGRYQVLLTLADGSRPNYGERVSLLTPGPVERDIRLAPKTDVRSLGEIRGIVVDGTTGAPVQGDRRGYVSAGAYVPSYQSFWCHIDASGRFRLRDLPPGTYTVDANVPDRVRPSTQVVVEPGAVVENVRLALARSGRVRLRLVEFPQAHPRDLRFHFVPRGDGRIVGSGGKLAENGGWETTWPLAVGPWTVTVGFARRLVQRSFEVRPDELTEVVIRADELRALSNTGSVAGTLVREDGAPVAGASVTVIGRYVTGISDGERTKTATTDVGGRFSLSGLRPGQWRVQVKPPNESFSVLPDLVLSLDSPDPFPLRLVLPNGSLTGVLVDKTTGRPLAASNRSWLSLNDVASRRNVSETHGTTGPRIKMAGIPAGDYRLIVVSRGYKRSSSRMFRHDGRGKLDLGRIALEPCASLVFEIVDAEARPIPAFHLFLDGKAVFPMLIIKQGDRHLIDQLPVGKVTVEVQAEGHQDVRETLHLQAGKPAIRRFVLERR